MRERRRELRTRKFTEKEEVEREEGTCERRRELRKKKEVERRVGYDKQVIR